MSDSNNNCAAVPLPASEVTAVKTGFYGVAVAFLLWGVQFVLAVQALYILWNRGLRNSLARKCMSAVVLTMLAFKTATCILKLEFYIVQVPTIGSAAPIDLFRKITYNSISQFWLIRSSYIISDFVVVWRAWVLWPGHRMIQWTLSFFMVGTFVCTTATMAITTISYLRFIPDPIGSPKLYPLSALLYVPLLATNVLATGLICYKAWLYRQDIRVFATDSSVSSATSWSNVRVDRTLALFIETGGLYVVFFFIYVLSVYGIFDDTPHGFEFHYVWGDILIGMSCIHPTLIIILVSKFMSQGNATARTPSDGSALDGGQMDKNEPRPLSTIRFDLNHRSPVVNTVTSLSSQDEELLTKRKANTEGRREVEIV